MLGKNLTYRFMKCLLRGLTEEVVEFLGKAEEKARRQNRERNGDSQDIQDSVGWTLPGLSVLKRYQTTCVNAIHWITDRGQRSWWEADKYCEQWHTVASVVLNV